MNVNLHPKEGILFSAYLLFFVIHGVQTGVGIVGLPRIVYLSAKHDAWISVLIAGALTSVVLWFMIMMLKQYDSADLYGIHVDVFGKWVGNSLSIIYMLYMISSFFIIFMNYIEIVQVWIFPNLATWQLALVLILLTVYAVYGGVRIIVGVAFLSVVGTMWILLVAFVPLRYADFNHLFPIMNVGFGAILKGVQSTTLSMMGFELIMFLYPYIKEKKKSMKYVQIANIFTTILFAFVTLISIVFFAGDSLKATIWPVLSMFKIVRLPNLERFEFIAVSFWMLIILPNMCIYLWASSKGFARVLKRKQKTGVWVIAIVAFGATFFFQARYQMNMVTDLVAKSGFYAVICYPVVLSIIVLVKKWWSKRRNSHAKAS
ncbi:GerAB/ArcD/ProY family transporter [Bacillus sp. 7884-1]|uniref:GerAB/ArcD/ProY family transporter n=1 Tax=Bacillus sp. 7884-1 TaxID=2021693 RepID=UPI000BA738E5|nr:GerAB/ArcD/ProY family transporter [Bacillus sp. 7884-1]PAE37024.1 spore gernimation protein [Bacillus sp. 7884-1]